MYLAECLNVQTDKYEHFGIFTNYNIMFLALQYREKDSARITEFEIDKPNGAVNSVWYVFV